ncbi:MAG: NADH-quinone oxidoreductase subunit C [Nitrosopumilus sp. H13]|nr:MAG: NADH-quinone oxidoreductase subunit C [Nitrosopumilus sp. H13]
MSADKDKAAEEKPAAEKPATKEAETAPPAPKNTKSEPKETETAPPAPKDTKSEPKETETAKPAPKDTKSEPKETETAKPAPKDAKPEPKETKPVAKETKPAAKTDEPELPAFEKGISDKLVEKFGDKVAVKFVKKDRVGIAASRDNVHDVAEFVRDGLGYDHVESVSGVDYPQDKEIEVVYHIGSYTDPSLARQILVLSTRAQREESPIPGNDATKLPSLRDVFYSVEFHEREVFEMLGVYFEGHPDNRRLQRTLR